MAGETRAGVPGERSESLPQHPAFQQAHEFRDASCLSRELGASSRYELGFRARTQQRLRQTFLNDLRGTEPFP